MKVLLFSNDLMPFGNLPTSGGGLRCWQLMKGLEAHGIEVVVSMPGFTYLAEKHYDQIPPAQRELLWRWETQDEILRRTKPDAVLFASNWDHFGLSRKPDVPLIIDLHGSRLIETSMWNTPVSTDRKVQIFSKADCLLTAGTRQRSYFYGWLLQAGRVPDSEHFIRYIPVSLSPEPPTHHYPESHNADSGAPHFVSGGGWFPWQNQAKAIFTICREVQARQAGQIEIYGTPHETQNLSAEERSIRDIYAQVKALADASPRIQVRGYVGREELIEIYRRASVAVEVMRYNLERELAFTTRTVEYLWCGLPVLYNDYAELSGHIKDYDAGWTVDPDNEEQIRQAVEEIFSNPELVRRKGLNAQQLVRDRLSWDKTIEPLLDFLRHPKRAEEVEPAVGPVGARASYLTPGGTAVELALKPGTTIRQRFIIPAENISTIEVSYARADAGAAHEPRSLELTVQKRDGRMVAKKRFETSALSDAGTLRIEFPLWRRPFGGQEYQLELRAEGGAAGSAVDTHAAALTVRGLLNAQYPFVSDASSRLQGKTMLGAEIEAEALALSFVPAGGRLYRIRAVFDRAVWMLRNGEWDRLRRAAIRRVPGLVHRLRHALTL